MIDSRVQIEHTRLLFAFYKKAYLAAIPFCLVLFAVYYGKLPTIQIVTWVSLSVLGSVLQVLLATKFEKAKLTDIEQCRPWVIFAYVNTFIVCSVLAYSSVLALRITSTEFFITNYFLMMGIAAFSACGFKKIFMVYVTPLLISFTIVGSSYFEGYWYLFVFVILGFLLFYSISQYYENTLIESIQIRFEKQDLLHEVEQKREEAEQANRAKSVFLASASHDLRQPLHALNLYLSSMRDILTTQEQKSLGSKMGLSIDALNSLFDSLLDISKLDAGITKPVMENFEFGEIASRLELNFHSLAKKKELKLSIQIEPSIVRSDSILLERILSNLLSNAIRYTDGGEVCLKAHRVDDEVVVSVEDTGVGIPDDEIKKIFTEFYQLSNPERDRAKGLGLGLFIVRRLCDMLAYDLKIESQLGVGTKLSLVLPQGDVNNVVELASESDSVLNIVGTKVIVVDDEQAIRHAMTVLLKRWKCEPQACASLEGALRVVQDGFVPDIIISDYRLADSVTGADVIQAMQTQSRASIPAILVTGDTSPDRLQEASRSGYELLHKPVNPGLLKETITFLVNTNVTSRSVPQPNLQGVKV